MSLLLLTACGENKDVKPMVPPDLLTLCPGYVGKPVATQQGLLRIAVAERNGRICANQKIEAIGQILGPH